MKNHRLTPLNVGTIPNEWSPAALEDFCSTINNGFVGKSIPHQVANGDGVTYVQGFNVRPNRIDLTGCANVTHEFAAKHEKARLRTGDLLTVQSGHIGTTAVVPESLEGGSCHALIISRPDPTRASSHYLAYYMNSPIAQRRMLGLHVGSTIKHINTSELAKFRVPLPPLAEQAKIAEILLVSDMLIAQIGDLVAAKRKQKRALMQVLLTGRKRLPGFRRDWSHIPLSAISDRITRTADNPQAHHVLSITAGTGFVSQAEKFSRVIAGKHIENYVLLRRGEFSYNKGNSYRYPQGCVYQLNEYDEGLVPSVFYSFGIDPKRANHEFVKQYFLAGLHSRPLYRWINTGVRNNGLLNLNASDFFKLPMLLPDLPEQRAIADILMAADAEIQKLEEMHAALHEQKRCLMQKLLTGQVRVKV